VSSILAGAGSSDLIFLALRHWLSASSRVLILDPTYGEYAHVLERVIGCTVDRLTLSAAGGWQVVPAELEAGARHAYDLVVLVNPNSPTGALLPPPALEVIIRKAPANTRWWIDETYVDYCAPDQSLEPFAASSHNTVVCKSMSKAYALSGLRAAYLCGPSRLIGELRHLSPPWSVGLLAQVAAVAALQDAPYYLARYAETGRLRAGLAAGLATIHGLSVVPGVANFLLAFLPPEGPAAAEVVRRCSSRGLFVRDASPMGTCLGDRAIRIAVKDAATNVRIVAILRDAIAEPPGRQPLPSSGAPLPRQEFLVEG